MSKVFNYIKKQGDVRLQLQEEVKMKDTSLDYIDEKMLDLIVYLQSEKFYDDPTVQVADVLRRLEPIRSELCNHYCDRRGIDRPLPHSLNLHLKRRNNGN
tara:strand:+ start:404 stop:703 length:300 start_codon:yes stop_codon:yes gene_type:complete